MRYIVAFGLALVIVSLMLLQAVSGSLTLLPPIPTGTPTTTTPPPTPTPPPGLPENLSKLLVLISETLELIRLMSENLRNDSKVMVDASLALVRIEAVAGVLAERAYEKAREGDLEEAVKLANQSLKLLEGAIEAHRGKAEVFETYSRAISQLIEAIAELVKAVRGSS